VHADPRVEADRGRVALARGPIVYAFEAVDDGEGMSELLLPPSAKVEACWRPELLGGVSIVEADGFRLVGNDEAGPRVEPAKLRGVPYCTWDNRAAGEMLVWLPESTAVARLRGERDAAFGEGVRLTASHCFANDSLAALLDEEEPKSSDDHSLPRHTFWDHQGTREWLELRFDEPREVKGASVYWFDDTGRGQCRLPEAWSLSYLDGDAWKPVTLAGGSKYGVERDVENRVGLEPVRTRAVRLEIELQDGWSGGVLSWKVD